MKPKRNYLSEYFIRSIYNNDVELLKSILTEENINDADKDGRTAIFHSILSGRKDVLREILRFFPNINVKDKKGWYPLHYVSQNYSLEMAKLLMDMGANIEVEDDFGNTPLWRAVFASQGKGEMIELLLSYGARADKVNASGISPLKLANTIANYNIKKFFH